MTQSQLEGPATAQDAHRLIAVCRNDNGDPTFTVVSVECCENSVTLGIHFSLAAQKLETLGFQEPFIFFEEKTAPSWLLEGVQKHCQVGN